MEKKQKIEGPPSRGPSIFAGVSWLLRVKKTGKNRKVRTKKRNKANAAESLSFPLVPRKGTLTRMENDQNPSMGCFHNLLGKKNVNARGAIFTRTCFFFLIARENTGEMYVSRIGIFLGGDQLVVCQECVHFAQSTKPD